MPKLTNITVEYTCFFCGSQAHWVSINSKRMRCDEKINRCPAIVKKAQAARDANMTPSARSAHMKAMSDRGNSVLKELHLDKGWVINKGTNISNAVTSRGGHVGINNPMYGRSHNEETKQKLSHIAQIRDPACYLKATDTKIARGIAIPKGQKTEWELYKEQVLNHTYKSWQHYQSIINPLELQRGHEYELDHKFSITEGFKQSVSPSIIGHYANLELIPKDANRSKRINCSITLEELVRACTQ